METSQETIRITLSRVVESFERIDAVVCTTFSFDPSFFELNVLPVICRCADGSGGKAQKNAVNRAMKEMPISVYYDPVLPLKNGGDEYCYRTFAVSKRVDSKRVFFHPKCIIIGGYIMENDLLKPYIKLLCGSANLTMKGWGSNCESFGILDLTGRKQQAFPEINAFLNYLGEKNRREPSPHYCESWPSSRNYPMKILLKMKPVSIFQKNIRRALFLF